MDIGLISQLKLIFDENVRFLAHNDLFFLIFCSAHVAFRLAYLFYIGGVLRAHTGAQGSRAGKLAWRTFKERASFILNLDSETFIAATIAGSTWGAPSARPAVLQILPAPIWMGAGILLILIGGYVKWDAYRIIGNRGWYWYNFFCPTDETDFEVEGVYRYLENPMYGVGYLPLVGLALLLLSPGGFLLALFDWGVIWIFYYFCERPHTVNILHENHEPVDG